MNIIKKIIGGIKNQEQSKSETYLLSIISELKEDKRRLQKQNDFLLDKINMVINKVSKPTQNTSTLTNKEEKLYNYYLTNPNIKFNDLLKVSKIKINSLRVVLSTIRKKGYDIKI